MKKNKVIYMYENIQKMLKLILGCLLISLSYNIFIAPNKLVSGGVSGLAIIINNVINLQNSTIILTINAILLIISMVFLGRKKTNATILGSILFPIFVRITENINVWLKIDTSSILFSTIIGGIIFGVGAGIIYKAGFTTGGTDILNQIVSQYFKISIGNSMLIIDGAIVITSGLFFGINNMMYSIVLLYIISLISDRVILGISESKVFFIATSKEKEVKLFIIEELGHGVTIFHAEGGFKNKNQTILMTTLPTRKYYALKEGIRKIDTEAFYIITDTYEVFGGE